MHLAALVSWWGVIGGIRGEEFWDGSDAAFTEIVPPPHGLAHHQAAQEPQDRVALDPLGQQRVVWSGSVSMVVSGSPS